MIWAIQVLLLNLSEQFFGVSNLRLSRRDEGC